MFFMTRKRFEEAVSKRLEEHQRKEDELNTIRELYNRLYKLEDRIIMLECKPKDGVVGEVQNAEKF